LPHDRGHDDPAICRRQPNHHISARVTKFSRHFGRSPDRLGIEEVRAYQLHLTSQGVAWASLNQTVCALRFFFGVTLGGWGAAKCRR
jgi:Phage integrase, N-terminal SAM-like domain